MCRPRLSCVLWPPPFTKRASSRDGDGKNGWERKGTACFTHYNIFVIGVRKEINELKRRPLFASSLSSTEVIAYNYLLHRRIGN
eukprot:scaffold4045_cov105-Skeletonema_dohrnii-CCMP3373.AAC.5